MMRRNRQNGGGTALAGREGQFPRVPKVREYAEVTLTDGSVLKGYVFIEATSRIQDLLNSSQAFFPFVDDENVIQLLNKNAVVKVRPYDG